MPFSTKIFRMSLVALFYFVDQFYCPRIFLLCQRACFEASRSFLGNLTLRSQKSTTNENTCDGPWAVTRGAVRCGEASDSTTEFSGVL